MFVGVSNEQPLAICARVGVATVLAYARVTSPTMAHTYRVCMVYDHVYSKLFVCRNSIPSNKMLTKYTDYTKVVGVEYSYCFNSGHQESSQPFIMDCMFRPL